MNKPQEQLELLITAFVVSELATDSYRDLITNSIEHFVSKEDQEKYEQQAIEELVQDIMEEINKQFTEKEVADVVLSGECCLFTIHNIVKFPNGKDAKRNSEEHPFSSVPVYTLEDFLDED